MRLFDKLLGRKSTEDRAMSAEADKANQAAALYDQSSIEKAIAERKNSIRLDQCLKVSFKDVTVLGTAFSQLIPALRTITVKGVGYLPVNMAAGDVLKTASKGLYYGAHVTPAGKSVMTKWAKIDMSRAVTPINPAMIMMTAMLANIEKKLDAIHETQTRILSFLEQDKQAEQQGNLNVLTDILQNYKYNWDNEQYLQNHHMKVLDIKQASEKNIIFYQEQIASAIQKLPAIHLDQAVKTAAADLSKQFRNYRIALYLFSFSSFLEVMLLGNFRQEYLEQIASKVQQYSEHYQIQFSKCHDMMKQFSADSLETKMLEGIGNASKALSKLIASTPVRAKDSVAEWLQNSGEKLLLGNDEKTTRTMSVFTCEEKIGSEIFIDSIRNVDIISNQTTGILFDNDALYLATA